jgi:DNA-binding IclR family transcriptional regulator
VARVLDAVPVRRAQGPARIAATAGLPLSEVERALGRLQLLGLVEESAGSWRLAADARLLRSGETHESDTPA